MKVYCIPGLAADERVFQNVQLPSPFILECLQWIPYNSTESLSSYAERLSEQIDDKNPFGLLGLSMGGMLVTELALQLKPSFVILISSVPHSGHLPFYYRWAGKLQLHKVFPIKWLQQASFIKRFFTTETTAEKALVRDMIRKSEAPMIRWGLTAIINWKQEKPLSSYFHIHGSADFILPCRYTRPTHVVKGGGHLMILNRSAEINKILAGILEPYGVVAT